MRRSSIGTTGAWPSNRFLSAALAAALLSAGPAAAFKTETPEATGVAPTVFEKMEAGLLQPGRDPETFIDLARGDYRAALNSIPPGLGGEAGWYRTYLEGVIVASRDLVEVGESRHFRLFTPRGQEFLGDYAVPVLESAGDHFERTFGHRPDSPIRVEIYPDKESFSAASTLSLETLERSGAIGICKFHRIMILSPRALPLGYRWLDALSHEYVHLLVNELTHAQAELWLHEGTARYFETSYRLEKPDYLTPSQKTALMDARVKGELIEFRRMSPSMVYLKNQKEVSLAFAQVSHAVELMVRGRGLPAFLKFLSRLRSAPFPAAFKAVYRQTPDDFESAWKEALGKETWEPSKGALSDEIRFDGLREDEAVGAGAQARIRLGDRMRMRGHIEAAQIEYDKALEEEPDNAVILLKAARARLALGRPEEARVMLRRAVEKNPNYATPMIELAPLVGDAEAERLLREANAVNPFDPRVHSMLSDIHGRNGRAAAAAREGEIAGILSK